MRKLRHGEVWYSAQVYTAEEQSLESSPGHLKPELVQVTVPYSVAGQGRTSRELDRGGEGR